MARIRRLDPRVIDQIAAGEVVERPASVVKELVENSLDAGARRVWIQVEGGGLRAITVTDDGAGMDPDDATLAVERHATSKITTLADLQRTFSLGFRGEALAAIAAVARLELVTRTPRGKAGYRVVVEGGIRRAEGPWPSGPGTRVTVRDLFFNTPARRKHLKGPAAELARIVDVVTAHALAHPEVRFQLHHGHREILRTSGSGDRAVAVLECFGPTVAGALIPVEAREDSWRVAGYVGAPGIARATRSWQFFSINGRPVRQPVLRFSAENAYRHLLPGRRYPVLVLDITLPAHEVDVNVHPAKLEVRLVRERAVAALVHRAVQQALARRRLLPGWETPVAHPDQQGKGDPGDADAGDSAPSPEEPGESAAAGSMPPGTWSRGPRRPGAPRPVRGAAWTGAAAADHPPLAPLGGRDGGPGTGAEKEGPAALTGQGAGWVSGEAPGGYDGDPWLQVYHPGVPPTGRHGPRAPSRIAAEPAGGEGGVGTGEPADAGGAFLAHLTPLGQVLGTYLACAGHDGLYLVDQHAAHERIYFERFLTMVQRPEGVPSQPLAVPAVVDLAPREHQLVVGHRDHLARLGFQVEAFGARSVLVRAVPAALAEHPPSALVQDLVARLWEDAVQAPASGSPGEGADGAAGGGGRRAGGGGSSPAAPLELERAASSLAACKAAIKAGDLLHPAEMVQLLRDLAACRQPYTCPHGRPTVIRLGAERLERMFGRRGG